MADNDNPEPKCPRCGAVMASDAPEGLCPRCLIGLNLVTETEMPDDPPGPDGSQSAGSAAAPTPSCEEIARFFPQLEILECLGRGGMGAVYKVRQPELDRVVALKILLRRREGGAADTGFDERFTREARALARLNHPSIVAVHEYGAAGGYPFLIMEYVDGLTLRRLLQRGKLAPEEALAIVPKICDALQFAHQKGIVHRDIKPENILLDKMGQVKITDFGIAKVICPDAPARPLTGAEDVVGTPHYMAPEQVEQPGKVDHRADIFSLGVVFYEMLTGELPLGRFQPPSYKVRIDARLDEVVLRALAKEPERRYQRASDVKTDVETIATSAATPVAPVDAACAETPADAANRTLPQISTRISRLAITGAIWALLFPLNMYISYTPAGWAITSALRDSLGNTVLGIIELPMAILGFSAPVGVTLLGLLAIHHIRHARGRLWELGLALFDALLFPLLLLNLWPLWLGKQIALQIASASTARGHPMEAAGWIAIPIGVFMLAFDVVVIRLAWRTVRKPIAIPPRADLNTGSEAWPRDWGMSLARRLGLVAAMHLLVLETCDQLSVHWRESTGELCGMALFCASIAALIWAAWPVFRRTRSLAAMIFACLLLVAGLWAFSGYYNLCLRPNLGLYEEAEWVAKVPGFQWGWRLRLSENLWTKPAAQAFGREVEVLLPISSEYPVTLLDLDTGRQDTRAEFDENSDESLNWARAEKLDLAAVLEKQRSAILGLSLGTGRVPHRHAWTTVSAREVLDFWVLDRKPPTETLRLTMATNMTGVFVFRTREGTLGLLQFLGETNLPRGVKLRYKLIQAEPRSLLQLERPRGLREAACSVDDSSLEGIRAFSQRSAIRPRRRARHDKPRFHEWRHNA